MAAFLVKERSLQLKDALKLIKIKTNSKPSSGLLLQLQQFEMECEKMKKKKLQQISITQKSSRLTSGVQLGIGQVSVKSEMQQN